MPVFECFECLSFQEFVVGLLFIYEQFVLDMIYKNIAKLCLVELYLQVKGIICYECATRSIS